MWALIKTTKQINSFLDMKLSYKNAIAEAIQQQEQLLL